MHIERRDLWWSLLGQLVAAVYWPNPLVWLALSRQREESEKASDDGVVNAGIRATEYADHLVSIASARTLDLWMLAQPAASGLEMARTNQLEKRIKSMFSPLNSRAPVGKASAAFAALAGLLLLAPVAGWRIAAQDSRTDSGIVGTVSDASGAAVPGAKVIVTFPATATPTAAMQGVRREVLRSSPAGEFRFAPLPAGVYTMQVRKEGFAQLEQAGVVVEAGKTTAVKLMLNVGQLQENITIRGNDPAPASADSFRPLPPPLPPPPAPVRDALSSGLATAASQSPGGPVKIRVGGNVMASKLEQKIAPRYPADCKAEHLEGTVLLRAVIGKDGTVVALESVNEFVDQRFRDSAMEAVRQWRYRPTLLNGQPVEVVTEVEVNFTLLP
jgi:TonB family protein